MITKRQRVTDGDNLKIRVMAQGLSNHKKSDLHHKINCENIRRNKKRELQYSAAKKMSLFHKKAFIFDIFYFFNLSEGRSF